MRHSWLRHNHILSCLSTCLSCGDIQEPDGADHWCCLSPGCGRTVFAMRRVAWAKGVPGSPAGAAHFSRTGMSRGANALACDAGGALDLPGREEKIMVPGGPAGGGRSEERC